MDVIDNQVSNDDFLIFNETMILLFKAKKVKIYYQYKFVPLEKLNLSLNYFTCCPYLNPDLITKKKAACSKRWFFKYNDIIIGTLEKTMRWKIVNCL